MSEIVNIPLGGVSNEPNDYGSEDGALSLSLNAVKHHGSIRPVMPGSPVADIGDLPANMDVVAIHEVGNMKHYILLEEIVPEEEPAGARPGAGQPIRITVHYLCLKGKVQIWWTSSYGDYFAGAILHLYIGAGEKWDWLQVPYDSVYEVEMANIAVSATLNEDGTVSGHTLYEFPDNTLEGNEDCLHVLMIGQADGTSIGYDQISATKLVHYAKTEIKVTVHCLPDKLRLGYTSEGLYDLMSVSALLGQGSKTKRITMQQGEVCLVDNPSGISVGTTTSDDGTVSDIMYNHPEHVLSAETIKVTGAQESGSGTVIQVSGSSMFDVSVNVITAENQDTPIDTGSKTFFPDSKEDATYLMSYRDAAQEASDPVLITNVSGDAISVTPMGNVLTVAAKGKPLNYIIWKDGEYHVLGSEMDAPRVYPYLLSNVMDITDILDVYGLDYAPKDGSTNVWEEEVITGAQWSILTKGEASFFSFMADQQKYVGDKAFAIVNSAHKTFSRKGYFWAPFYVRFALRMYDGSHIMHTPPQLMIAGSGGKPILYVDIKTNDDTAVSATLNPTFVLSQLCLDMPKFTSGWSDLITSLDVFVSPPLINFTDSATSIPGAGIILPPPADESEESTTNRFYEQGAIKLDDIYMKSRKQMGNVGEDFLELGNLSRFISVTSVSKKANVPVPFYNNALKGRYQYGTFYLFSKSRYPNLHITSLTGQEVPLQDATPETKIGYINRADTDTGENIYITLADTGLTNLDKYWYIETDATKYYENYILYHTDDSLKDFTITGEVRAIRVWSRSGDQVTQVLRDGGSYALQLDRTDGQNYKDIIQDNNVFHLVHSIPMKELQYGWEGLLPIGDNILDNLDSRQTLPDQGQMRSRVTTDIAPFAYNNRLSMAASTWDLPATSAIADFCVQNEPEDGKGYYIEKAWIKALVNGQVAYKRLEIGTDSGRYTYAENIRYFYYPCHEATHLILQVLHEQATDGKPHKVMEFSMGKHKLLDGAYLFNNFDSISPSKTYSYATRVEMLEDELLNNAKAGSPTVTYGNMVRVSGVSNPFYFNEVNQVTLPTGTISGLSTTARALSQGQFGAFPLYCFSDNGIWALEVSDTGTYSARQPVSRAVCTNPDSITQTEGQVLFVTKRGLMALDGSSVTCLSEILSGHNYTSTLSRLDRVKELAKLQDVPNPDTHIEEWLQDARLLYDDKRQMLYAFNEEDVLGYVYSISDQAWGMMVHDLAHPLPCYTDALAVTREDTEGVRRLINMSNPLRSIDMSDPALCGTAPRALLITRPLTMGVPDGYKTLEALVTRGMLDKDDAQLVIWASNDLKKWAIIATSQTSWYRGMSGTPYKYFRIGLLLDWEEQDSVNGLGADITPRLNNRLR